MTEIHPLNNPQLMPQPKIVLEGTHLTLKTDLAFALAEHHEIVGARRHRWHIPLLSAEWETRNDDAPTKAQPGRSMINFGEQDVEWAFDCFRNHIELLRLHRDYYWIIDRYHISTLAHQGALYGRQLDLGWVDSSLRDLGFVLVHCWRHPDTFPAARENRLQYSENPERYNDLGRFVREQELMADLISTSSMSSMRVDVSDDDVDRVAQEIIDWMKSNGTFWWQR